MKLLKFIFIILLITSTNNLYAKPVPPGAGDGEVAANILFLVDSSASMNTWIGNDGLGAAPKLIIFKEKPKAQCTEHRTLKINYSLQRAEARWRIYMYACFSVSMFVESALKLAVIYSITRSF